MGAVRWRRAGRAVVARDRSGTGAGRLATGSGCATRRAARGGEPVDPLESSVDPPERRSGRSRQRPVGGRHAVRRRPGGTGHAPRLRQSAARRIGRRRLSRRCRGGRGPGRGSGPLARTAPPGPSTWTSRHDARRRARRRAGASSGRRSSRSWVAQAVESARTSEHARRSSGSIRARSARRRRRRRSAAQRPMHRRRRRRLLPAALAHQPVRPTAEQLRVAVVGPGPAAGRRPRGAGRRCPRPAGPRPPGRRRGAARRARGRAPAAPRASVGAGRLGRRRGRQAAGRRSVRGPRRTGHRRRPRTSTRARDRAARDVRRRPPR